MMCLHCVCTLGYPVLDLAQPLFSDPWNVKLSIRHKVHLIYANASIFLSANR